MEKILIRGGTRLEGSLCVHGAKNAVLPILAASLLTEQCVLHNCPWLTDVEAACHILECLGAKTGREGNSIIVRSGAQCCSSIPSELMHKMRSSIVFLGAIVARCGEARISMPGGCELGPRPIDLHLSALERLGVQIKEEHGFLECRVKDRLRGAQVTLPFPSVGATENIMIAAVLADGETVVKNAAREPEINDLADFLNKCGAKVSIDPAGDIHIAGVKRLHSAEHTVIGDRIVAATYLCAGAITGGDVTITGICSDHLSAVYPCLEGMGCTLQLAADRVRLRATDRLKPLNLVRTMPYPGFPTDAQSPLMAVSCLAKGSSLFVENIFESRYKHVPELCRMGADIKVEGRMAVVCGVEQLYSTTAYCTDLRGGAAIAVAALAAKGESELRCIEHIRRGYASFEEHLCSLGAQVQCVDCADA